MSKIGNYINEALPKIKHKLIYLCVLTASILMSIAFADNHWIEGSVKAND